MYKICECGRVCETKQSYCSHHAKCKIANPEGYAKVLEVRRRMVNHTTKGRVGWSKGLTKDTDPRVARNSEANKNHPGRVWTEDQKKKLSESMKKAHAEGRARGWLDTVDRSGRSYPERFFAEVIDNHFTDKNYVSEYRVKQYAIDFAWVDKKLAIEIDGSQHETSEYQKWSDKNKDQLLYDLGWKVLRIRWIDMFHEPSKYIEIARKFIEDNTES